MKNLIAAVIINIVLWADAGLGIWLGIVTQNAAGFLGIIWLAPSSWWLITAVNRYRRLLKEKRFGH